MAKRSAEKKTEYPEGRTFPGEPTKEPTKGYNEHLHFARDREHPDEWIVTGPADMVRPGPCEVRKNDGTFETVHIGSVSKALINRKTGEQFRKGFLNKATDPMSMIAMQLEYLCRQVGELTQAIKQVSEERKQ